MKKENDLGTESIGKLIKRFSIPCVISMLVAALYNIVDQIYIGWSAAGTYGNAATNIVYPFTVLALAIALLFGDGSASLFSLSLGAKDKKKANKSVGNGLFMLIVLSLIMMLLGFIFEGPILSLFGGNPEEVLCYGYATDYFKIICLGIPFYIIGQGLNASIRADGSPKYAMLSTLAGAILNIILDPIFIFALGLEVKGAAIATVMGQILTFALSVTYLFKSKSFKITKESLKLDSGITKQIISLGFTSFITQVATVIILSVTNNLLTKYGYMSIASTGNAFGSVEPIAVSGICMKVYGIIMSMVIGVSLGGQPIIGYNMGAGKTKRVKDTCKIILTINVVIGLIAFLLFELCPNLIISIFGSNTSVEYQEYAKYCLNIFYGGIILTCFVRATSIFLQAMGSSKESNILAISRDVIFFVPSIIIIASVSQSIVTMLYSAIIADVLAFVLAVILIRIEFKKLDKVKVEDASSDEITACVSILNHQVVICISREYGSGGRYIASLLAEQLGINFYDKALIDMAAQNSGISKEYIKEIDEAKKGAYSNDDRLFIAEKEIIEGLAKKESCVIVGRCADYILKDNPNVLKVFIYTDDESKVARAVKYYGMDKNKALKQIDKINKERARHYKYYTNRDWNNNLNYDICLNSNIGIEECVNLIKDIVINFNS